MTAPSGWSWLRLAWLALAAALFVGMALVHADRVNVDPKRHDQDSYLAFAVKQKESSFTALGTRRQMPIYPTLQALFYTPGMSEAAHFARAKRVNIALSAAIALALAALLARLLPKEEARNVALVTIFFVIAFRAPYVQAEVLVYAAIFVLFVLLCAMWRRPSLPLAIAAGGTAAIGFLVKGTTLLGLYVFLGALAARELVRLARRKAPVLALKNLALGAVTFGAFFAGIWPYAKNSKEIYGAYLYDMNTRYVMWCDSWEHYASLNWRFGTHDVWKSHPPPEIPTMGSYLATHSIWDIVKRTLGGLAEVIGNCLISHGYALFFVLLWAFATALVKAHPDLRRRIFRPRELDWVGWFVLPYLAVYLLVFGFYGPLGAGERFSLAMFVPATYAITRAFAGKAGPEHTVKIGRVALDWAGFQSLLFALLVVQIVTYFAPAMATQYAGG